jgi:hypothetical protein
LRRYPHGRSTHSAGHRNQLLRSSGARALGLAGCPYPPLPDPGLGSASPLRTKAHVSYTLWARFPGRFQSLHSRIRGRVPSQPRVGASINQPGRLVGNSRKTKPRWTPPLVLPAPLHDPRGRDQATSWRGLTPTKRVETPPGSRFSYRLSRGIWQQRCLFPGRSHPLLRSLLESRCSGPAARRYRRGLGSTRKI